MDQLWITGMVCYADVAIECRDQKHGGLLFDRLAPWADQLAINGGGTTARGPVGHYLGRLATVLGRYDDADAYFTQAAAMSERVRAKFFAARTDLLWGRMHAPRARLARDESWNDALGSQYFAPHQLSFRGLCAWNHTEADAVPATRLVVTELRGVQHARACCNECFSSVERYVRRREPNQSFASIERGRTQVDLLFTDAEHCICERPCFDVVILDCIARPLLLVAREIVPRDLRVLGGLLLPADDAIDRGVAGHLQRLSFGEARLRVVSRVPVPPQATPSWAHSARGVGVGRNSSRTQI